ncbi:phosphoenolpyruvate--protein phosphotransferase [bacterium]|nr:phosphoenolpyruvate--protein phosphotransferase [bacterium]MBU1613702.1 phosphoenolpyruvate--protein phosphotransferase [bacterium]
MKRLKGTVIAQGIALGRTCLYQEDLLEAAPRLSILEDKVEEERKRLLKAVTKTIEDLRKVSEQVSKSLSAMEAEIFNAHIMILENSSFIKKIEKYISEEKVNAEAAILQSIKLYEKQFKMLPDDYIRERIQDINDIAKRLLRNLGVEHKGFMCACPKDEQVIVVAEDLTPSLITGLDHKPVAAIVTERGSKISHGAILARALGVPAMIGVKDLIKNISCGTTLLVDADKGDLYLSPDPETISNYSGLLNKPTIIEKRYDLGYASTKDGARIQLAANAGSVADINNAQKHGLKDVGLFRTEFVFLARENEPDIKEQVEIYAEIIDSTDGTVTFRLLDIGGDKLLGYLPLPKQDNPNLGLRGVRIYDKYPRIIANQIKALLMAKGEKPMRIMIPMVSTLEEFRQTKEKIYKIAKRGDNNLKVGCMIEVPSALYIIKDLVDEADFLSIGTNDLIQYLMGTDRSNIHLSEYLEPFQPAMLKVLDGIIKETKESGKEISVCGEMAGDPGMARILVGLGYKHLSLNPYLIDKVGEVIGQDTLEDLEKEVREILKIKTLAGIKQILSKNNG